MNVLIKNIYTRIRKEILSNLVNRKTNIANLSIISMNCMGGIIYHDCNSKFLSPTINLYMSPSDFIKFVNNIRHYVECVPKIHMGDKFPIGEIDDITIYFMHYTTVEDAFNKWEIRKKRINYDNIFVIMSERDGFCKNDFIEFKKIKYPKILFTRNDEFICEDSVYLRKYRNLDEVPDIISGRHMYYRMKIADKINSLGDVYKNDKDKKRII